jgi:hypothetical protein
LFTYGLDLSFLHATKQCNITILNHCYGPKPNLKLHYKAGIDAVTLFSVHKSSTLHPLQIIRVNVGENVQI